MDFFERKLNKTYNAIDKIKEAIRLMTILEFINEKNCFKYKVLEKYISFCEDEIFEAWF